LNISHFLRRDEIRLGARKLCRKAAPGYKTLMRFLAVLLLALPWISTHAAAQDVLTLLRAGNFVAADAAASQFPDPVAQKLVRYYRLLTPNAATADELSAFLADSPDWPLQGTIARRRDESLVADADDADVIALCTQPNVPAVATVAARLRCADAFARAGRAAEASAMIRRAWIEGPSDPVWEAGFMQRFSTAISSEDQRRRFDRLAWTDAAGAKRQEARLDVTDQPLAEARLALKRDDASALAIVAALPAARRSDPGLVLEQARWLRRAGQDADALALWRAIGTDAERAAPTDRVAAFWTERDILARRLLREGDDAGAYALVTGHAQRAPEQIGDAEFLAGFIALRRLKDQAAAQAHFLALARVSKAAITQARAHFWLGRTAAARGDATSAAAEYGQAAAFPNTYYGQLAILAAGDGDKLATRIAAAHDPVADTDQALALAGRELARAAATLVAWGEPRRAQGFLLRLADVTPDPPDRALAGRMAAGFGLPDIAITIARRAGRDGVVLLDTGWPIAADVPDMGADPALCLGVIRQESSFDGATISPAGARGLMQLMPGTAAEVAKKLGLKISLPALTADAGYNMQLGATYLRGVLDKYDGFVPLAVAAYNAGPGRVADWLAAFGDPRVGAVDPVDWIELIPINETRNYVQRVIENTVIYRVKRGEPDAHPLAQWLR
jgi:soluble lytic murein transglycosylase